MVYAFLIILAQLMFSATDLWKKMILGAQGFSWKLLTHPGFIAANMLALVPLALFYFALSKYGLAKSAVTLGVSAVLFSSFFAVLFLQEKITAVNGVGYAAAVLAIVLINLR